MAKPKTPKKPELTVLHTKIDPLLHAQVKAVASLKQVLLRDFVADVLQAAVDKEMKKVTDKRSD